MKIICIFALFFGIIIQADELGDWISRETPIALSTLKQNISRPGTARGSVVASSAGNADYYYHWVRDAALTMDVILREYQAHSNQGAFDLENMLLDFAQFSIQNQSTQTLSGGPGEPKFYPDGRAYLGEWRRPQDDSPALRALVFTRLARLWMSQGKTQAVLEKLYNSDFHSLIKMDLEYVSHNWQNISADLWEEVRGHHFYTRMVQRRALLEGADLADALGERDAANWYRSQAWGIETELWKHWDESKGIYVVTRDFESGVWYKDSGIDASVILGVLHGGYDDGFYSITDDRVLSTAYKTEEAFHWLYPINQKNLPAAAIGRYPEDKYDGHSSEGEGNAWFLLISGFAEYHYRLEKALRKKGEISINGINSKFYSALGIDSTQMRSLKASDAGFETILQKIRKKGDDFLLRVKVHTDENGRMAEQVNRTHGYQQGAGDLTWSYAAFLTAVGAR